MAYSALVHRLLISCPGDVPVDDLAIVHKAINRWNGVYGQSFGAVMVPISWGTHAAAEFGQPPQEILNRQLVDRCDICLALFANRLGTATASAESGTAEEIQLLGESGRYVAILHSRRPVDASRIDYDQAQRLQSYLTSLGENALILDYASDDELSQRVDTILAAAVARDQGRADLQLDQAARARPRVAEVWPHVDSTEYRPFSDRPMTARNWYLVLANTGEAPAQAVQVRLEPYREDDRVWRILDQSPTQPLVESLAPHSEVKFPLAIDMAMARQVRCVISWTDERGPQENLATLRAT